MINVNQALEAINKNLVVSDNKRVFFFEEIDYGVYDDEQIIVCNSDGSGKQTISIENFLNENKNNQFSII